ncbi:MAG: hypothetical protein HDR93_00935 [Bacteroides sp.]|nr:hypothetical protein [Bacteroides sp.]MBD5341813.1 hypothetical protein [Bacteroides sp.]
MTLTKKLTSHSSIARVAGRLILGLMLMLSAPSLFAQAEVTDSVEVVPEVKVDLLGIVAPSPADSLPAITLQPDTLLIAHGGGIRVFNPDPVRAVWLSALCPGLGQIYNRRYWKLPIVVGGYMGLAYATDWNNAMLRDYTKAYRDLMDNDPDTKSYMDFFAPGVTESQLSKSWLESVFQSRRNYFRRNRDLCIIGMVGVYILAIVDAYVDASLAHFDITPDLSLNWSPVLIQETRSPLPSVGIQWALCF